MKKIYTILAAGAICVGASAQSLNPQVQVTNDYLANFSTKDRNALQMRVPDSLKNFRTKVDYSVFSTDYKGAYEFTPYDIKVVPEAQKFGGTRFYMRAGAGYTFHPVLQAVLTPKPRGLFRYSIYQDFNGYMGNYHDRPGSGYNTYKGYDFMENIGAQGRVNGDHVDVFVDLNYKGIFTKDALLADDFRSALHDVNLTARVTNNRPDPSFFYDIKAGVGYAADIFSMSGLSNVSETGLSLDARLSPELYRSFRLAVDGHVQSSFYSKSLYGGTAFMASVAPRFLYTNDWLDVDAGAKFCFGQGVGIYPDAVITAKIIRNKLGIYLAATGGEVLDDYSAIKNRYHWFNPYTTSELRSMKERLNARLGFRGSIASRLQFDINGGYAIYKDAAMMALVPAADGIAAHEGLVYAGYNTWFANAMLLWKSEHLDISSDTKLRFTDIERNASYVGVPVFRENFSAIYNWKHRAYAGVRCVATTAMPYISPFDQGDIKGYVDLGLYAEYRFVSKLSVWAQVGNLLDRTITVSPMHSVKGVHFTAGICLRIQ